MPEGKKESVTRLVAFVVAPGKTAESILASLRTKLAPVFLPRPIYLVESLPRNETGKLRKEDVEKLLVTNKIPTISLNTSNTK
jgi:acyl-coenzyme A synthetase/AMP-(fatty) acid ligase